MRVGSENLQALRGLAGDSACDGDAGLPGAGAGACWVISAFVIASSGSEAMKDILAEYQCACLGFSSLWQDTGHGERSGECEK